MEAGECGWEEKGVFPRGGKELKEVELQLFRKDSPPLLPSQAPEELPRGGLLGPHPPLPAPVGGWEQRHTQGKKQLCHVMLHVGLVPPPHQLY